MEAYHEPEIRLLVMRSAALYSLLCARMMGSVHPKMDYFPLSLSLQIAGDLLASVSKTADLDLVTLKKYKF